MYTLIINYVYTYIYISEILDIHSDKDREAETKVAVLSYFTVVIHEVYITFIYV